MTHKKVLIAPSILSADFARLGEEVEKVTKAGADLLHLDVMDGHFVPNISFGLPILRSVSRIAKVPIDCHLMISNPEQYIEKFADGGSEIITVHAEASFHIERLLCQIRSLGKKAGISFNPHSDVEILKNIIHAVDLVLVMTVNPGFGGQSFISQMLPKIARVAEIVKSSGREIMLQVDGGITAENKSLVIGAGANVIVAGSSVFSCSDYAAAIAGLR
ncbi:MAG TPA: ribulose-phosphate 3-epimerase [Candidatus Wallbacteria bacterium]|nr:ribulose-phosphate 3-epimerase [Candidatus Wallbacteria bacterium]